MRVFYTWIFSALLCTQVFANQHLSQIAKKAAYQGYSEEFISLVEMIYGKGFLSQGGEESVKGMVEGLELKGGW